MQTLAKSEDTHFIGFLFHALALAVERVRRVKVTVAGVSVVTCGLVWTVFVHGCARACVRACVCVWYSQG
jgi:hypothetical protein